MAISLKIKGKIENGQLILDQNTAPFPWDGDVEIQVTLQETDRSNPEKQEVLKDAGMETDQQILEHTKNQPLTLDDLLASVPEGFRYPDDVKAFVHSGPVGREML